MSILQRGARGGVVALAGQGMQLVIQFAGTVILARLLSPEDFGLYAMLIVFLGVGVLIQDFGMPTAALQARELSEQQASTVFWVTIGLSVLAAVLLILCSPLIVALYDQPKVGSMVLPVAGVLILNGAQAQYNVRLAREMRFYAATLVKVSAALMGLGVAIATALLGGGYWALVMQSLTVGGASLGLSMCFTRWLPRLPRRNSGSLPLVRMGAANGVANILSYAADNADNVMLGTVWGPGPLGQYNRAFQLFMTAVMSFFSPLTSVVVPTANRAIAEGKRAEDILVRAQTALCGSAIWILLVTAATAPFLVPLLLGNQWNETIKLLQILSLGGAFRALSQTNYWAYLIEQQSAQLLFSNLVTKPLQILMVVIAAFHSVEAVAWAFSIGRAITWPINVIWLWRTANLHPKRFTLNGMRFIIAAVAAFLATEWLYQTAMFRSQLLAIGIGGFLSTAIFFTATVLLPGGRHALDDATALVRLLFNRR